jgi:hypothetical protein
MQFAIENTLTDSVQADELNKSNESQKSIVVKVTKVEV